MAWAPGFPGYRRVKAHFGAKRTPTKPGTPIELQELRALVHPVGIGCRQNIELHAGCLQEVNSIPHRRRRTSPVAIRAMEVLDGLRLVQTHAC